MNNSKIFAFITDKRFFDCLLDKVTRYKNIL